MMTGLIDSTRDLLGIALEQLRGQGWNDDPNNYPRRVGILSAMCDLAANAVAAALKHTERIQSQLAGIETWTVTESRTNMPVWSVSIPAHVPLTCPHCGTVHQCDVQQDDEIDTHAHACYYAEVETAICEDCGKHLCATCPRFPHPDDKDLIQCAACHEQHEAIKCK